MGNPSSVPKTKNPKVIKDLRKISCTSDYSKLFERFLKTWILEDIQADLDLVQFGNQKGPNIAIQKFSTIGVRASINQLLASYHQGRYMMVKFNGTTSSIYHMPGGDLQGTLLGVLEYLVQCNDYANCVQPDLRFKYVMRSQTRKVPLIKKSDLIFYKCSRSKKRCILFKFYNRTFLLLRIKICFY